MTVADALIDAAKRLRSGVDRLRFCPPTAYVYNPLDYAWPAHEAYVRKIGTKGGQVVFLGMNPGPWGMAQTGVPFGHVPTVRDWLRIDARIRRPNPEHPKRPIEGLDCKRGEVSGERLWGLFRDRYGTSKEFFKDCFVANYCPLVFMEASGRNRTPDKLPTEERLSLQKVCDVHLASVVKAIQPRALVGVGAFAEACLRRVIDDPGQTIVRILHPSPASPAANRGWAAAAKEQLTASGVWSGT